MGLTEIPIDVVQLSLLETLIVSNNKITSLKRVEQLANLREINAQNNNIGQLHRELQDMYCLESINLVGNPVVNQHPQLAKIDNNETALQAGLEQYFGGGGSAIPSLSGSGGTGAGMSNTMPPQQNSSGMSGNYST
jgi:Leucine-rich repeat (LRR) protein